MPLRRVCVFCGSAPGRDPLYLEIARRLGTLLAEQGLGLVYGGARVGMMGVLADAALGAGGEVVGVIPRDLVGREIGHTGVTRLEVVATMHERKARMVALAEAFVTLPGGYGTLDELFEVVTWAQLGLHRGPCGVLNVAGFYDHLLAHLDGAVAAGLLGPENRRLLIVEREPEALLASLAASCS